MTTSAQNDQCFAQESGKFSRLELTVLRTLFDESVRDGSNYIHMSLLAGLLVKLGKNTDEIVAISSEAVSRATSNETLISFENIYSVMEEMSTTVILPFEGPDPKVAEFLRILEEYRVKCEEGGNYVEAARAHKQFGIVRVQEVRRQQKAVQSRHNLEKEDIQSAHDKQYRDFGVAWNNYMEEYDSMSRAYIKQTNEKHSELFLQYKAQLREQAIIKGPKWSRDLLDMRRKQTSCARSKLYSDAERLKKSCDKLEAVERKSLEAEQAVEFAKKEGKYRLQQHAEVHALQKRIEGRRKEHLKQRALDSNRLLQRNRNVLIVQESKQSVESQRMFFDMKKNLVNSSALTSPSSSSDVIRRSSSFQSSKSSTANSVKLGSSINRNDSKTQIPKVNKIVNKNVKPIVKPIVKQNVNQNVKINGVKQAKFDFAMSIDMMAAFDDRFGFPPSRPDPLFAKYITDNAECLNPFNDVLKGHDVRKIEGGEKKDSEKESSVKSKGESKNDDNSSQARTYSNSKIDLRREDEKKQDNGRDYKQQEEKEEVEKRRTTENAEAGKKIEEKERERNDDRKEGHDDDEKRSRREYKGEEKREQKEEKHSGENVNHNYAEKRRMEENEDNGGDVRGGVTDNVRGEMRGEDGGDGRGDGESAEKRAGPVRTRSAHTDEDEEAMEGVGVVGGVGAVKENPFEEFLISSVTGQTLSA